MQAIISVFVMNDYINFKLLSTKTIRKNSMRFYFVGASFYFIAWCINIIINEYGNIPSFIIAEVIYVCIYCVIAGLYMLDQ